MPNNIASDKTINLGLEYMMPAQAQKTVTHNEALRMLDIVVQPNVLNKTLSVPPVSPSHGDRYLVASNASGAWIAQENALAAWMDGAWYFAAPKNGWTTYIEQEANHYTFDGSVWLAGAKSGAYVENDTVRFSSLGIGGASADSTNVISMNGPAALFNNVGSDVRIKINKAAIGDTASFVFQTGFSGRAEIGLTGDDDFGFKTSSDGNAWNNSLVLSKDNGAVHFPSGIKDPTQSRNVGQFCFTGTIAGGSFVYRISGQSALPRSAIISAVSSDEITLGTASDTAKFFTNSFMQGVSYVRVWNMTKSPQQSAWVKSIPSSGKLQITNASDIASWSNGDTLQIGDPATNCAAVDISPVLSTIFGSEFKQTGLLMGVHFDSSTSGDQLSVSDTGAGGSFSNLVRLNTSPGTMVGSGFVASTVISPQSNSNLLFVRENLSATSNLISLNLLAVLV